MITSRRLTTVRSFVRQRMALAGGLLLVLLVGLALFAPWISPQDPYTTNLSQRLRPGIWSQDGVPGFPLGTDHLGRDVLSRVFFGGRISLISGLGTVLLASAAGLFFGSFSLLASRIDGLIMRLMDVLFAFPSMLLALTIVAVLGPGLFNSVLAIAIVDTPRMARVIRGEMLSLKEADHMEAARALGAGRLRLLVVHGVPNVLPTMFVYASLLAGRAILTIAGLSYLGLGARPPAPEWGAMLSEARELMLKGAWWGVLLPGVAILMAVLAFNMLGDGLRDTLDPRLR